MSALTPINEPPDSAPPSGLLKKRRPATFLSSSPSSSPTSADMPPSSPSTPLKRTDSQSSLNRFLHKSRPKSLQKSGRPSSIFGSIRNSFHSTHEDENGLTRTTSKTDSLYSTISNAAPNYGTAVLHHGEIQTTGGILRKKSQYFVLTDTHLVRFKSQSRASEFFPSIPPSIGKASGMRHSRMSSSGSLHELHTTTSGETHQAIPLHDIVAVWRLDDGKPYFSIEINYMDDEANTAGAITLQLYDPLENNVWTSSIRGAVTKARLADPKPFPKHLVDYTARVLEQEHDYDPTSFTMFKAIQRNGRSSAKSSSEDLTNVHYTVCILAFGVFKVHLVPFPKSLRNVSNSLLSDMKPVSFGTMILTDLKVHDTDDAFSISFRLPFRPTTTLFLASSLVSDIALTTRHATEFLRPNWAEAPLTWTVPSSLEDNVWPIIPSHEPYQGYDRTLTAYCIAYDADPSRIRYEVHEECEDAPVFELYPPADTVRTRYTALELLAIMRSLRYNESFVTLSFRNISLDVLHNMRDRHGDDHVPWTTKSGVAMKIPDEDNSTLLIQEVRALAVKCRRLRRLDFSNCLTRKLQQGDENVQDAGCGICEALFPLCAKQWTNVDWILLNGIVLTDVDVDYIFSAAIDKSCHFRALDVGYCGLLDRSMHMILQALSYQAPTMESIDLSGNLARHDPKEIEEHLGQFEFVRKVNLSNISRLSGPEPLISAEMLLTWKLVDLRLSRTALNERSVDALTTYLVSDKSEYLRFLGLDQCRLTSRDAAMLLNALGRRSEKSKNMHINLSDNRLEEHHDALVDAIRRSYSPVRATMQMMEYKNEKNFQNLIRAFSKNSNTRVLDISKLSLPIDAGHDTCEILHQLFTQNDTLEEVDLSGEHTHIEAAQYGNGLYWALAGLKKNTTLKVLRIEHQKLGLQGASTLASVLEVNDTLREIHCENNEINLQAFTVLVNSLERNRTLLYLPLMEMDKAWAQNKVDREIDNIRDVSSLSPVTRMSSSTKATVNRTLGRTIGKTIGGPRNFTARNVDRRYGPKQSYTDTDIKAAVGSLSQGWDREVARLQGYLQRNYNLAHGLPPEGLPSEGSALLEAHERPETSESLATAMRGVGLDDDRTPTSEPNRQLGVDGNGAEGKEVGVEEKEMGVEDGASESEGDGLEMGKL